jgi:hypothetical protein
MRLLMRVVLAGSLLVLALAPAALAQHRDWHGNDFGRFHDHDFGVWRGGHWFHGPYGGRAGWWWIVGGAYYYYPSPIYPYPDPYTPPVAAPLPPSPTGQYWYYCQNPPGYYPYVPSCSTAWQPVPATASPQ